MHTLAKSFLDLFYPPLCLHCGESVEENLHHLCKSCLHLLELIDPLERCPICFSPQEARIKAICKSCQQTPHPLRQCASVFEYLGPAASLVKKMKYSNQPYLAKGLAGYLAAQFLRLEWPLPDIIVPVPISFTHWVDRGYNQSLLLAHELSLILEVPMKEALTRRSGDYSQAGLTRAQREQLKADCFQLKQREPLALSDKNLLLVDDVMTTGTTLRHCAQVLMEGFPTSVSALTVCRAT